MASIMVTHPSRQLEAVLGGGHPKITEEFLSDALVAFALPRPSGIRRKSQMSLAKIESAPFAEHIADAPRLNLGIKRRPDAAFERGQLPKLLADSLPAEGLSMAGEPAPVQLESCSMPTHHSLGRDNHKNLSPFGP
jgi:hypothetical protein